MNPLNKNRLRLLADELKSGKWKPPFNKGLLREDENKRSVNGIACEVYMDMTGLGDWRGYRFVYNNLERNNYLHKDVSIFFFSEEYINVHTPERDLQELFEKGYSFAELAILLEEDWKL